jgi:hypothetical protein
LTAGQPVGAGSPGLTVVGGLVGVVVGVVVGGTVVGGTVVALPGRHWKYQSFKRLQVAPATHVVPPVHPIPPPSE